MLIVQKAAKMTPPASSGIGYVDETEWSKRPLHVVDVLFRLHLAQLNGPPTPGRPPRRSGVASCLFSTHV